jgi:polyisoprenoid-binding protein YceI
VLVKARSNVGPIVFGTTEVTGDVLAEMREGFPVGIERSSAHLEIPVTSLASGNALYDAEIHRRMDARRYPAIEVDLTSATPISESNRFLLGGKLLLRDVVQEVSGAVSVDVIELDALLIKGELALDIRDFRIEIPTTLMLKIYPEVLIEMQLEARAEG